MEFDESTLPPEERWENLGLSNDFLFGKVMRDVELCQELIHRILPDIEIGGIRFPEAQKTIQDGIDTRGVRFDLYVKSDNGRVYDVEMQAVRRGNLPKRTRGYHILIGIDAMNRETMRTYNDLPAAFVIFICPFDPFGRGRHIYTFRNLCIEDRGLELGDEAITIFLNARGTLDDVPLGLRAFLDLVLGKSSNDPFVQKLERALERARKNSEWRREYMMLFMRDQEKLEEGRVEGRREGLLSTIKNLMETLKMSSSEAMAAMKIPPEERADYAALL